MSAYRQRTRGDLHVLIISQVPPPTHGSTVMTQVLIDVLGESHRRVHLVDRRFSTSIDQVGKFRLKKIFAAVGLIGRLFIACKRYKRQVTVLFATTRLHSFLVDWALSEVLRWFRRPVILYLHTQGYAAISSRHPLLRLLTKRLLGAASRVVCLSPILYEDISAMVPEQKVRYIANTLRIDPPAGSGEVVSRPQGPNRVLFLSNLLPEKGIDTFVNLALDQCSKREDIHFDIVGPETLETQIANYKLRVQEAGSQANVVFHGSQTGDEKWSILRAASCLVFPSTMAAEAQPLTIIEAFACGVPVVAYDVGGIADMVDTGLNGFVIEPGDSDALSEALEYIINSPDWQASARIRAKETYVLKYSREKFTNCWEATIRDFVKS